MKFLLSLCLVVFANAPLAAENRAPPARPPVEPPALAVPDGAQLEKELQSLPWPQFRAVVQAIPPLRAEVDAYGALGWQYVKARYRTHRWQKSIDRLKPGQRRELARLIGEARAGRLR